MAFDKSTPKASEYTATITFYGPDYGSFPVSPPSGSTAYTASFNSLKFNGGDETKDFKAGQQIQSLERKVAQSSSVTGQLNLTSPSGFLHKFGAHGPLALITITQDAPLDAGNEMVTTFKGLMKIPDIDFLTNPGTIDFEIRPYGIAPTFVITEAA